MNVFIFDENLFSSASLFYSLDKIRFNKQIIEATQLLSQGAEYYGLPPIRKKNGDCYKNTHHMNSPHLNWIKKNIGNFYWLLNYTAAHCNVYSIRQKAIHQCEFSIKRNASLLILLSDMENLCNENARSDLIFIGKKEFLNFPHQIIDFGSITDKYYHYLLNKHHAAMQRKDKK